MTTPLDPAYIEIPLSKSKVTIIDAVDLPLVSHFKWCAHLKKSGFYAVSNQRQRDGSHYQFQMARLLLGLQPGDPRKGEHANGNGLDNRRSSNLRIATHQQNMQNQRRNRRNTSGLKGVYFNKTTKRWQAQIRFAGKLCYLGRFATPELAYDAYCIAATEMYKEFARFY